MKHNLNKNKKNNSIATLATVLSLATIIIIAGGSAIVRGINQPAEALIIEEDAPLRTRAAQAPSVYLEITST